MILTLSLAVTIFEILIAFYLALESAPPYLDIPLENRERQMNFIHMRVLAILLLNFVNVFFVTAMIESLAQ